MVSNDIPISHGGMCGKKKIYSREVAHERATRSSFNSGELIIAYLCKKCRAWHIGHPTEAKFWRVSPSAPANKPGREPWIRKF